MRSDKGSGMGKRDHMVRIYRDFLWLQQNRGLTPSVPLLPVAESVPLVPTLESALPVVVPEVEEQQERHPVTIPDRRALWEGMVHAASGRAGQRPQAVVCAARFRAWQIEAGASGNPLEPKPAAIAQRTDPAHN
ncbi:MAG: hypothetical protein G8237_05655 [Magnetococcales bacterium]|nr:hypothetical protein [Magnetococcales bacterium]